MPNVMTLYLDDSGARDPDHAPPPGASREWFALGGVLVHDDDVDKVRQAHKALCETWRINVPLHSYEIRLRKRGFEWLQVASDADRRRFYDDLGQLITSKELTAIACVIDRAGYNARYRGKHETRWLMCKTAFCVVVERAAKFAMARECRLRVYVEQCNSKADRQLRAYYDQLQEVGQPFDSQSSSKYQPLSGAQFKQVLFEFRVKQKSSALIQLADIALHPICVGGYDQDHVPYRAMLNAGVLIDSKLLPDEAGTSGIKYSCWPSTRAAETQKPGQFDRASGQPSSTTC